MSSLPAPVKLCACCGEEKTLDSFYATKKGLHSWCKPCIKIKSKEVYQRRREAVLVKQKERREQNGDAVREIERKSRLRHIESRIEASRTWYEKNREKKLLQNRLWAISNPDRVREINRLSYERRRSYLGDYRRAWYAKHRDRLIAKTSAYRSANPDLFRSYYARRRLRQSIGDGFNASDVESLKSKQRMRCAACKCDLKKSSYHVDHIDPVSKGGENSRNNIQLLCPTCNRRKNARLPHEFMQSLGYLL